MKYTIKKLASISGVSVRTLHWYDEIGLLKPSYYGSNNYRYYEEEQLLILQQILFFRELGFPLKSIQKLLSEECFDKIKALQAHRKILEREIDRKNQQIFTIDRTVTYLQGGKKMTGSQLFYGVDSAKQKEYEDYIVQYLGTPGEKILLESKRRTVKWEPEDWEGVKTQGDEIHHGLAAAIEKGLLPESDEVQAIIRRHHELQSQFYEMTREVYIGLTEIYAQHPEFRTFFETYHPRMIEFQAKAMRYYANKNL
jgi:MerR family transcriptional regulator, thiopeptide resistance regulator